MKPYRAKHAGNKPDCAMPSGAADADLQLKTEHAIVWQGLEAANAVWQRVVLVSEIIEALTPAETEHLQKAYVKNIHEAAASILALLSQRGLVFSIGGKRYRYYGSSRLLNAEESVLPEEPVSCRRSVLDLTRQACAFYKRAVRAEDLLVLAEDQLSINSLSKFLVVRDLRSLADTGELRIVKTMRGDGGGRHLYLPSELNAEDYIEEPAMTWLDSVVEAFNTLWREREERADAKGKMPPPITTSEIRARLEGAADPHPYLTKQKAVTNAMKQLSETASPVIKRIKPSATGPVMWIPVSYEYKKGAANYGGSNANKIAVAVRRAEARAGHPVTAEDVRQEIQTDAYLLPSGRQSIARLLTETAKTKIAGGKDGRQKRVTQILYSAGKANGKTYYTSVKRNRGAAGIYVDYLNYNEQWTKLSAVENAAAIEDCRLFSVKRGRMMLLQKEANTSRLAFLNLLSAGKLGYSSGRAAEDSFRQIELTVKDTEQWLRNNLSETLPIEVKNETPCWTAKEIVAAYRPLYPNISALKNINLIGGSRGAAVRRIANSKFTSRFSLNDDEAAEYLFDRTDALINAAVRWGGKECRFQGLTARAELGLLRDARFVLPEMEAADYEARMTAVACAAFLQSPDVIEKLYRVLLNDPIASVRHSALWSYAFAGGSKLVEVSAYLAENSEDKQLCDLANVITKTTREELWLL